MVSKKRFLWQVITVQSNIFLRATHLYEHLSVTDSSLGRTQYPYCTYNVQYRLKLSYHHLSRFSRNTSLFLAKHVSFLTKHVSFFAKCTCKPREFVGPCNVNVSTDHYELKPMLCTVTKLVMPMHECYNVPPHLWDSILQPCLTWSEHLQGLPTLQPLSKSWQN